MPRWTFGLTALTATERLYTAMKDTRGHMVYPEVDMLAVGRTVDRDDVPIEPRWRKLDKV